MNILNLFIIGEIAPAPSMTEHGTEMEDQELGSPVWSQLLQFHLVAISRPIREPHDWELLSIHGGRSARNGILKTGAPRTEHYGQKIPKPEIE